MKKIEKRAIMCLLLAGVLVIGLGVFCFRYVKDGGDWATYTCLLYTSLLRSYGVVNMWSQKMF